METHQFDGETKGHFKLSENGKEAGIITYSKAGSDKIIIDHTEVNPDFQGRNLGLQLVMTVVHYARNNNLKIIPLCPFAKRVFERKEELRDVLAPQN